MAAIAAEAAEAAIAAEAAEAAIAAEAAEAAEAAPSVLMLYSVPLVCEMGGGLMPLDPIDLEAEKVLLH
jgi:hypothetical protein